MQFLEEKKYREQNGCKCDLQRKWKMGDIDMLMSVLVLFELDPWKGRRARIFHIMTWFQYYNHGNDARIKDRERKEDRMKKVGDDPDSTGRSLPTCVIITCLFTRPNPPQPTVGGPHQHIQSVTVFTHQLSGSLNRPTNGLCIIIWISVYIIYISKSKWPRNIVQRFATGMMYMSNVIAHWSLLKGIYPGVC